MESCDSRLLVRSICPAGMSPALPWEAAPGAAQTGDVPALGGWSIKINQN